MVPAATGWFAARPLGTEDVFTIRALRAQLFLHLWSSRWPI
jgi:hypothetical protein